MNQALRIHTNKFISSFGKGGLRFPIGVYTSRPQSGYIALSLILVMVVVVGAVSVTVAFLSIGEGQSALAQSKGEETWNFVDGCAEDALQQIHDMATYSGGTITRPEGTCIVTVSSGNPTWDITVTTTDTAYKRSVRVKATRGPTITITSWQEI
jgi:hypothetical protein